MPDTELDTLMRSAAFDRVRYLSDNFDYLTTSLLNQGFEFNGKNIKIYHPQQGIHRPKEMLFLLSIKTAIPKPGGRVWYDDQLDVHKQIFNGNDTIDYDFRGNDPNIAQNQWLREAYENKIPIIYFLGVAPGLFLAEYPVLITDWNPDMLKARVLIDMKSHETLSMPDYTDNRKYETVSVQRRLHQAAFREAVISAYDGRCALTGLPEPRLLDAAHIISDRDEDLGQPIIPNGLPLSKTHHAAFDKNLIGINPDYRIFVSKQLLNQNDGPFLNSMKKLEGEKLKLPSTLRKKDYPDRERLEKRFEEFKAVA